MPGEKSIISSGETIRGKAIARNSISITPLHLDWTNYASFETLLKRRI